MTTNAQSEDPSTKSQVLYGMESDLSMIRTLLAGTPAMREAGTVYLPPHPNEASESHATRLAKATLFNGLEDAIDNSVSRVFDEPVRIEETAPLEVQEWGEDLDQKGTNIHDLGQEFMHAMLSDGLVHCLVDFPAMPVDETGTAPLRLTLADERALGMRPYLTMVRHTDLVALYKERRFGREVVTHVRFKEAATRRVGFSEETVERIRLLEPGYWAVYEKQRNTTEGGSPWQLVEEGFLQKGDGILWDTVPFFTCTAGKRKGGEDLDIKPPFLDLAYLNVRHWQSTADQYNITDTARFPMLAVSGFEGPITGPSRDEDGDGEIDPVKFRVGPHTVLTTGDPSGEWYYVEHTGAAIEAGRNELVDLEERMAIAGLEPLISKRSGAQTATETAVDEAKSRAPLETWARHLGAFLERCIEGMCEWVGLDVKVKVHINTEVGLGIGDSQDINNLIQLRLMGEISRWTLYQELMRRGLLGPNFDPRLETNRMDLENPDDPGNMDAESDDEDFDDESEAPNDPPEDKTGKDDPPSPRRPSRGRRRRRGRGGRGRSNIRENREAA